MASPFSIFRRNQKVMLAIVAIGAMVAFVFLDPLLRYVGGATKVENPLVVETKFGSLTQRELEALVQQRDLVDRFLQVVTRVSVERQLGRAGADPQLLNNFAQREYQTWRAEIMQRLNTGPEAAAVETLVLNKKAEQQGLVVTDRTINESLKVMTADTISSQELQDLIRSLQPSRPVTVQRMFDALRFEMLATKYAQLMLLTLNDVPPAQRFEYYERLNRQADVEAMPLAVSQFIGQVADPSADELKKFYEEHKNRYPDPFSPEPGFKEPKRATFQYFKADVEALAEKLKPEVTEEEIKKYYDDNKSQFRDFGDADKPEEKPAEGENAEEKPAEGAEKPADEKPVEEKPAEPAKPEEQPAPQSSRARLPVRLVSASAQDNAADAVNQAPGDQPAEAPEKPAEEKPAVETPEEKPAEEKPATEAEKPAEEKPADPAAEMPADEVRYQPLEKVADQIRESIARQQAGERIGEQFEELQAAMRRYADEYDVYTTEKETNRNVKPPTPLNFAELAKGKDVEALELVSVSAAEAMKEDIGKSYRFAQNARTRALQTVPFVDFAFADTLATYKPEALQDNDSHAFLFWKTGEEAAFIPPFDQVKDKVTRAWKLIKAREPALKRAEEYAAEAAKSDKPLADLPGKPADAKVIETGPFSWLTMGSVPNNPAAPLRLTDVEGIEAAGEDFMRAVFNLPAGGAGAAMNHPQDIVYVVRVKSFDPPIETLRDDFAREDPARYLGAAAVDQRQVFRSWLTDLDRDAGVKWNRTPDTRRHLADEDEAL